MNLQKIGAYIAEKRKALGMTQTELAEKLGMSNKSVSKWERGVCLPDVSLYMELCDILGITINEFIAGEDLPEENYVEKSDENIIQVTKDGKQRRRKLKLIAAVLGVSLAALCTVMLVLHMPRQNYIEPLSRNSTEMMAAELAAGVHDVHVYQFSVDRSYKQVTVGLVTYEKGKVIAEEELCSYPFDDEKGEGLIAIATSFNRHDARISIHQGGSTGSTEFPLLDGVKNKDLYSRGFSDTMENRHIEKGETKGLFCLIYDRYGDMEITSADMVLGGETLPKNDYMYCFTVEFK